MKKTILIINTFILAVLAWFSGVKDVYTWLPTVVNPDAITLSISPKENVKVDDIINLNYTVPKSGYLALWN